MARLGVDLDNSPFTPRVVQDRGRWSQGRFANFAQHDASEAFDLLLDACDEVDYSAIEALALNHQAVHDHSASTRYSTPCWKMLGGIMSSETHCHACGVRAIRYEMWRCLPVPVPRVETTVEQRLLDYWGTEPLSDPDDHCDVDTCGVYGQRSKTSELVPPWPRVLLIHLKRWEIVSVDPFQQRKNSTPVLFEMLLPVDRNVLPYSLRSVIVHHGDAGGGHYTSYVRSFDNFWYHCDDFLQPRRVGVDEVLAAEAYMLFYEQ